MKPIRLLINLYPIEPGERFDEITTCFEKNSSNPWISEIVVLDEGFPHTALLQNAKVKIFPITQRPTFADFYDHLDPNGINLISNNDIWFDDSLKKVNGLNLNPYDLLCLTRREADGTLYKAKESDAQDSWFFLGQAEALKECTFSMGIPGCENRLAFLFFGKRYRVLNPSRLIATHHEHASQNRSYQNTDRIKGHYLMTKPIGLLSFHFYRLLLKLIQKSNILRVKDIG